MAREDKRSQSEERELTEEQQQKLAREEREAELPKADASNAIVNPVREGGDDIPSDKDAADRVPGQDPTRRGEAPQGAGTPGGTGVTGGAGAGAAGGGAGGIAAGTPGGATR